MPAPRYYPDEFAVVLAAGVAQTVDRALPALPGYREAQIVSVSHDETMVAAGATILDLLVEIIPQDAPEAFGGAIGHSPYACAPQGTDARNTIRPLVPVVVPVGGVICFNLFSATGGTFRIRTERIYR